jgi:hypothetical protein
MSDHDRSRISRVIILSGMIGLAGSPVGCVGPVIDRPVDVTEPGGEATLAHGYALLLDLLADEAKVDGILAIKSPRPGVAELLRRITSEATSGEAFLRSHLNESPAVDPGSTGLPLLEHDARRRIEKDETPGLLLAGGRRFETRMLLTQQKAAQYAGALCAGLSAADPNRMRAAELRAMSDRWNAIERETRAWLTVVETPPATTGATPDPVPTP